MKQEVPNGAEDCLAGLTFVISGTLDRCLDFHCNLRLPVLHLECVINYACTYDSLEREEAEDLIKRHGGRVTTSVSKKTVSTSCQKMVYLKSYSCITVIFLYFFQTYLLADEDVGGRKSQKAKELGFVFTSTFLLY